MKDLIIVSACLAGLRTTYRGGDNQDRNPRVVDLVRQGRGVLVCPEQLGGLPTPRAAAEIVAGTGLDIIMGAARVVDEGWP